MGVPIGRIHLASPLGGSDLKLSDFRVAAPLAWTPDGGYLAAQHTPESGDAGPAGIYLVPVDGGEPRPVTTVTRGTRHVAPAFSRDGRRLAYGVCVGHGCEIYVVGLRDGFVPSGPARKLTNEHFIEVGSIAWTRDGRSLVFGSYVAQNVSYLWRLNVDARSPAQRIELAGIGAAMPSTALANDQLAFARWWYDMDIYRFQRGRPPEAIVASTFAETEPRYSPDGRRIAFTSARSGSRSEIWVAESDGTNPQQLTRNLGIAQGSPSWSPDGRRIAFDSLSHRGFWNIWVIDADGGTPQQITTAAGQQHVPTWSRDGRWVYFSATQEHSPPRSVGIWRVPAAGGPLERLTRGGTGMFACETADGTQLLYQAADADSALLALPLTGGAPRQLVACVKSTAFGAGPRGVYYVPCDTSADPPLRLLDPETGHDELLGKLERLEQGVGAQPWGLSISPDGESVLYLRHISDTSDLMLIENFR
jgi:Tol biopolymer transport system component